ncbi:Uncharacterized conserved protein, DUF1778 family [Nitrosomonas sp. Nm51]|uniref:type II toxin-antitoxin system TacA family antitoxin n=1 Tax=Nitrosomonas sp. Nm51 TaxID=133720 RepID=UPI0008B10316|nr:DUF1778 domain-containing protein [Nitrosomonas sp. Nm51]SER44143.1 Uncharacterized conserved protein, DUF1778 family [Nitrosomonas sp. Nm51]
MPQTDKPEKTRFDGQLSKEQKQYFEYAAELGGFRTLTEFVFSSAQEKADKIVAQHKNLLASERDKEIFFSMLMNPPEPNAKLRAAADRYQEVTKQ